MRSPWLVAFLAASAIHLVLVATDAGIADSVTKALLMPLLAAWVVSVRGPRLLVAALLLSWVGDVALEIDGAFLVGMAGFAAAHVCYITWFVRAGALDVLRRRWWIAAGGLVVWAGVLAALWAPLGEHEPALRIPIALYALLLTATAVTALAYSPLAGVGGVLFLLSDTLIALDLAHVGPSETGLAVMITYLAAQLLLATGITRANVQHPAGLGAEQMAR
ncbi:putative membrane protein YhhN [Mumia flava]|uniref:Putative membrane protein YhhN n=1 Tax=Mumia flava TaxID=1348852 RepID=A0A2M9BGQ1_9ACTN|nr:lysoplasmalogenase [Mumia flava]PJJ57130.1 putative membrane protein YhhN [Mumia flava]